MNHETMVKTGNRLADVLTRQAAILSDPNTIPQQLEQVKAQADVNRLRLDKLSDLIDADCDCGHGKASHLRGRANCTVFVASEIRCSCVEWDVTE